MNEALSEKLSRLLALLQFAAPDAVELQSRILRTERNIILPARLVVILILYHSFQFSPWIRYVAYSLDVGVETVVSLFWIYAGAAVLGGALLLIGNKLPATLTRGTILMLSLLDAIFLAGLTLITGGYDSILYWAFVVLVLKNTYMDPLSPTQLLMNFFTAACYLLAGVSDYVLAGNVDESTRLTLGLDPAGSPGEGLLVRTVLLLLVAVCGFGVQLLLERQRRAAAEAREFSLRENQLRSTGRLAAEIAHQLKNPLAIINNTTFSLQRAGESQSRDISGFTAIIREEIERADRILTQIMGYARLTEGKIEKLDIPGTLEDAVKTVFPKAAEYDVTIRRRYQPNLPPLMMQREHLQEIFVNLLANARDASPGALSIHLQVCRVQDDAVEITIKDNGPGISSERQAQIFEAYYTTKPRGTGLGLAIAKNNTELYSGRVRVESELGKGTSFILLFPATVSNPAQV